MPVLNLCTESPCAGVCINWVPGRRVLVAKPSSCFILTLRRLNSTQIRDVISVILCFAFSSLSFIMVQIFVDTCALFTCGMKPSFFSVRNTCSLCRQRRFSSGEASAFSSDFVSKHSRFCSFMMVGCIWESWLQSLWLQIYYGAISVAAQASGPCRQPAPSRVLQNHQLVKALQSATFISFLTYKLQLSLRKVLKPLRKFSLQKLVLVVSWYAAERIHRLEQKSQLNFPSANINARDISLTVKQSTGHYSLSSPLNWIFLYTHVLHLFHHIDLPTTKLLLVCVFLAACCLKNAEILVSISQEECLILVLPIKDHFQKHVYLKLRCSFYHFLLLWSLECLSLASKCFCVILYHIMSFLEARKLLLICVTHDPFLQYS